MSAGSRCTAEMAALRMENANYSATFSLHINLKGE
jgi:hypothetical protein